MMLEKCGLLAVQDTVPV